MKRASQAFLSLCFLVTSSCTQNSSSSAPPSPVVSIELNMTRIPQAGLDPFQVTVTLKQDGSPLSGKTLSTSVPRGTSSSVTDQGNGTYTFLVTPTSTGTYPVTVSYADKSITRKAVVLDILQTGAGQAMAIPGDFVNTDGYEDGSTITPDGQYLFVHYGPIYMSGLLNLNTICSSGFHSIGYDLNTCDGRTNSSLVFQTKGPFNDSLRPRFPSEGIQNGKLLHLPGVVIAGVANGIVGFPTVFYGFKRQADGTFAEPFKVAFQDARGINGPYGLSFKLNGDGTAIFAVAWNNYFNDLGDDKPDIYTGTLTLGQDKNLGDVTYSGEFFSSITPHISPVNFSSHTGVQGNPHLASDSNGNITSIWSDDEQVAHDLSVYRLTAGSFPNGTWVKDTLPSVINTGGDENQPFFTGQELIFRRGSQIVSHAYRPTNGSCASGFTHNDCWGSEVVLLGANGNSGIGEIFTVGEPTIAQFNGKKFLHFTYIEARSNSQVTGVIDWNAEAGFVEIP